MFRGNTLMKTYHNSPLLYEEGFSIIINEVATPIENSTFITLTTINEVTLSTWIFHIFTAFMN